MVVNDLVNATRPTVVSPLTIEDLLHHPALLVPLTPGELVDATVESYEAELVFYKYEWKAIRKHTTATLSALHDFAFSSDEVDNARHRMRFEALYWSHGPALRA